MRGMVGLMRSPPFAELQLQQQEQKMHQQQRRSSRRRSELSSPSLAPPTTQNLSDVQLEVDAAAILQPPIKNWKSILIHTIALPNSVSIIDIQLLILSAFDNIVAPTLTSPYPKPYF